MAAYDYYILMGLGRAVIKQFRVIAKLNKLFFFKGRLFMREVGLLFYSKKQHTFFFCVNAALYDTCPDN